MSPEKAAAGAEQPRPVPAPVTAHTELRKTPPVRLNRDFYISFQLVEIEAAFKNLKDDLGLRPIHHQLEQRIEAHIFVAFMAYCLYVTLRARLKPLARRSHAQSRSRQTRRHPDARGSLPHDRRSKLDFKPLHRYTELNSDQKLLLSQLNLNLPPTMASVVETFCPGCLILLGSSAIERLIISRESRASNCWANSARVSGAVPDMTRR